jgi:hypothetical protein
MVGGWYSTHLPEACARSGAKIRNHSKLLTPRTGRQTEVRRRSLCILKATPERDARVPARSDACARHTFRIENHSRLVLSPTCQMPLANLSHHGKAWGMCAQSMHVRCSHNTHNMGEHGWRGGYCNASPHKRYVCVQRLECAHVSARRCVFVDRSREETKKNQSGMVFK